MKYVLYFIHTRESGVRKGYVRPSVIDWLTEAHEEHGDILPSECVMIIPGTVDVDD